jgi:hypothetical protein
MANEMWRQVLDTYSKSGLQTTFIETLGWLAPQKPSLKISVDNAVITVSVIAQLAGAAVVEVTEEGKPSTQWHRKVDSELKKHFSERLTRFSNESGDSWYWPKKLASGALSYDRLETKHLKLPDFLAQRLAGLHFSAKDHLTPGKISPNEVRNRIRGQFESSKVTSDFFKKFKEKHEFLKSQIMGLPDEQTASSYSTLILNRLMFVYFLQKKEFLNNDANYLKNCLHRVQALKGKDKFYSFYRDYLLELFFNRLDKTDGKVEDPAIAEILGDVPYVNGGVFSQSDSERDFKIDIPDDAFQQIFDFFDSYSWHLDTRPTGVPNEINPEVIGYIFEQYINFTEKGKKDNGAYYTTHDVTGFMVSQTLVPRILDSIIALDISPWNLLRDNPKKYIPESMKHGQDEDGTGWIEAPEKLSTTWAGDPTEWNLLDESETDARICLADESWVEMFYRRKRVQEMSAALSSGSVISVNELVTKNLSAQELVIDTITQIDKPEIAHQLWEEVSSLSVIDPTCGSGAFLFAALEVLEDVYSHIADRINDLAPDSELIQEIRRHPNRRYFLRKHAALRNLHGTDIMEDAIETAKLRIFLSLVSCLESKNQIEPLPDLDFNLKVGNLVVGFRDEEDVGRVENGRLLLENKLVDLAPTLAKHVQKHAEFMEASIYNSGNLSSLKEGLRVSQDSLRHAANTYYAECANLGTEALEKWLVETKPFHWIVEFPSVIASGGFDVVIGNPPYIKKADIPKPTERAMVGFYCQDLPNFYATCVERSKSLLKETGRFSMIVMLSLSFGTGFQKLRSLVIRPDEIVTWWSTFGKLPSSLFMGKVKVRNTILSLGPGKGFNATKHNIFTSASRTWLFESLEFANTPFTLEGAPIRGGLANGILSRIAHSGGKILRGTESIYLRPTGQYWYPVIASQPPVLNESLEISDPRDLGVKAIPLDTNESKEIAVAILAGKIGFAWWGATGDDFHCKPVESVSVRLLVRQLWNDSNAKHLARKVAEHGVRNFFARKNDGDWYVNIRWSSACLSTDLFDAYVLKELELSEEWRNLHIWYRQTMRSSGDSASSVDLDKEQVQKLGLNGV